MTVSNMSAALAENAAAGTADMAEYPAWATAATATGVIAAEWSIS
jgi:hypothetical protein